MVCVFSCVDILISLRVNMMILIIMCCPSVYQFHCLLSCVRVVIGVSVVDNILRDVPISTLQLLIRSFTVEFGRCIVFDPLCWEQWYDYHGILEGYVYQKGLHQGLYIRRPDTGHVFRLDLNLELDMRQLKVSWFIKIVSTETWRPEKAAVEFTIDGQKTRVVKSTRKWHVAMALKAIIEFATEFGQYGLLSKNCQVFSQLLIKFMHMEQKKYDELSCEQILNYDNLVEFSASLNTKLIKKDKPHKSRVNG